jgi:hypothetical protein
MVRTRLVLLVTLAALVAPWVAPCLAAAPSGHAAMACCHRQDPGGPVARACCVPADREPGVPPSAAPSLSLAAMSSALAWAPAPAVSPRAVVAQRRSLASAAPRLLATVLLI